MSPIERLERENEELRKLLTDARHLIGRLRRGEDVEKPGMGSPSANASRVSGRGAP